MKTLHPAANSLETAVVVDNYPYGSLKCKMHFFVEEKKGKWRPVRQTINPKTGRLNKPHKGVYSDFPIYVVQDETGFVEFVHTPRIYDAAQFEEFFLEYGDQIPDEHKKFLKVSHTAYLELGYIKEPIELVASF